MIKTRQILPLSERMKGLWRKIFLAAKQSADISIINLWTPSPKAETPSALARQGGGLDRCTLEGTPLCPHVERGIWDPSMEGRLAC